MTRSFAILLSCLISFSSVAEIRKYSNEFLAIGIGARALGMSGAQVASVSDVTGGFWNPAGLLGMTEHNIQVGAMHTEYFAGIAKYDYGALAVPLKDKNRVVGISIIRFGVDDIPNTLHLIEPDGSINYDNIVAFSAADYAFMGSYAQKISEGFRVGGTAKIIHRKVGTFGTAWGFGIDIGAQYDYNDFTFGVLGKDITGTYNAWTTSFTQEEKEILQLTGNELPGNSLEVTAPKVIIGAAWHKELDNKISLLGELDFDLTTDGQRNVLISAKPVSVDPHFGIELGYAGIIFLRAGIGNIQKATDDIQGNKLTTFQPNAGIGLKLKSISIDYAFTDIGNQSQVLYSHVFSLRLDIDKQGY